MSKITEMRDKTDEMEAGMNNNWNARMSIVISSSAIALGIFLSNIIIVGISAGFLVVGIIARAKARRMFLDAYKAFYEIKQTED